MVLNLLFVIIDRIMDITLILVFDKIKFLKWIVLIVKILDCKIVILEKLIINRYIGKLNLKYISYIKCIYFQ